MPKLRYLSYPGRCLYFARQVILAHSRGFLAIYKNLKKAAAPLYRASPSLYRAPPTMTEHNKCYAMFHPPVGTTAAWAGHVHEYELADICPAGGFVVPCSACLAHIGRASGVLPMYDLTKCTSERFPEYGIILGAAPVPALLSPKDAYSFLIRNR